MTAHRVLASLLPLLVREANAERVLLRPLEVGDVHVLISSVYGLETADVGRLAAYLVGRTEGNPLFIWELLRSLEEEDRLRFENGTWRLGDVSAVPVLGTTAS